MANKKRYIFEIKMAKQVAVPANNLDEAHEKLDDYINEQVVFQIKCGALTPQLKTVEGA